MWILIFQRLFVEAFLDVIYFPLWWYTGGLALAARGCFNLLKSGNDSLAPGLWLRNIGVPMFGQYDWEGRLISVLMRSAQIVVRAIGLLAWLFVCVFLFLLWLAFPVVIVWGLVNSLKVI